ncbi:MAG: peptide chain release factor N(5)-glutamine methyltransferase [Clostridia bacterium]
MTINEARVYAKKRLELISTEALCEVKLIFMHILNCDASSLFLRGKNEMTELPLLEKILERREAHEPLQYILGEWEFMGLPIKTDGRALIPRTDTETVVLEAISLFRKNGFRSVLDMCCGSGCIGIALGHFLKIEIDFSDISEGAIALSQLNSELNSVKGHFYISDLFSEITKKYDMIVINPPYLSEADMEKIDIELLFEPKNALFGGIDGLDYYRRIKDEAYAHLNENGVLIMEIGANQGASIKTLFNGKIIKDTNGLDRCVIAVDNPLHLF